MEGQPLTSRSPLGHADVTAPRSRAGGIAALLLAASTATSALVHLLVPAEQRLLVKAAELLPSVAQGAGALTAEFWLLSALGIAGLGAVPAVTGLVAGPADDLLRWAANVALVGYAVMAISNLLSLERLPKVAAAFAAGDESTRAALAAVWRPTLDPWGVLRLGGVGVWILVLSLVAVRRGPAPRAVWQLGVAVGVGFLVLTLGFGLALGGLFAVMIAVVTLASVAWFAWLGARI